MTKGLKQRFDAWQRKLTETYGADIGTPEARRAARLHYLFVDHGWLRVPWKNFDLVAEGVYRANQPSPARLRAIHAKVGLKAVLNLRGMSKQSFYLFEAETCRDLGLQMIDLPLSATKAPTRERLVELLELLHNLPKPVLMHCKSGADRTGLAAALYLLEVEHRPLEEARRQLSLRYTHVARSAAGILDHILRHYEVAHRQSGIGFADWARSAYDQAEMAASFARWRAGDRRVP
jgi:protein tyrosine/serine phosphatase